MSQEANVVVEPVCTHLETVKRFSYSVNVCCEAISVLIPQPDVEVQAEVGNKLCKELRNVIGLLSSTGDDVSTILKELFVSFHDFHRTYFLDLGEGLPSSIVLSLLHTFNVMAIASENYDVIKSFLIDGGFLHQNILELEELKNTLAGDSFAQKFIIGNLMVIYNCSRHVGFHCYFKFVDPISIWEPYCKSSKFDIKFHSKIIAGWLINFFPYMDNSVLQLEEHDIEIIIDLLSRSSSSHSHEVKDYNCIFSTEELLLGIRSLLQNSYNADGMLQSGILVVLSSILVAGSLTEQQESIHIMWTLSGCKSFVTVLNSMDLPLADVLLELEAKDEKELRLLIAGLFPCISSRIPNPEACYTYGRYKDCLTVCNSVLSNSQTTTFLSKEATSLLKGKSLFKLFKQKQSILKKSVLDERDFRILHHETYTLAKDAILIFDKLTLDVESSQMFDIAMMEFASETNGLDKIRRCLLCTQKAKLLRSHMCPYSILKEFCSGMNVPDNLRVFDRALDKIGHCNSPKEAAMYAFCHSCEEVLSNKGENDFLPQFFRKVYSKSDLTIQSSGRCLEYGPWLYHFCIGMLFRALIQRKFDDYFNHQEIYDFCLLCRKILLDSTLEYEMLTDLPQVFILLGPHRARKEDKDYGFVNQVLNDPYFSLIKGSKMPPYHANFVEVHIGIIHILMIFSPFELDLPSEYRVNPKQGIYIVPPDEERCHNFPPIMWEVVQLLALDRSKGWLERPLSPLKKMQQKKMNPPDPSLQALFHVSFSVLADLEVFETNIVPSPDPNNPRIISLLPRGFDFRPTSSPNNVILPKGHQILLHYSTGSKECYFIAVGGGGEYAISKPYVIYGHCEPGLQFSTGFFIDPETLNFIDFLPLREGKVMLERLSVIEKLKQEIEGTVSKCLKMKGVKKLHDILQLLELDDSRLSIDTKCFGSYCWYCQDKCLLCLKPAGSNYTTINSMGKMLRYCSSECFSNLAVTSQLKLTVSATSGCLLSLKVTGSCIFTYDESVIHLKLLIYLQKGTEEDSYPLLFFYQSRTDHLQAFFECDNFSTLADILKASKLSLSDNTGIGFIATLVSVPLEAQSLSSSEFYSKLAAHRDSSQGAIPLSSSTIPYPLPVPLLKASLLDIESLSKEKNASNEPNTKQKELTGGCVEVSNPCQQKFKLTEKQFAEAQQLAPPNCAMGVEFFTDLNLVQFDGSCSMLNEGYISLVKKLFLILLHRVNQILQLPLKDDNRSNESVYEQLSLLYAKTELCLNLLPSAVKSFVGDYAQDMCHFISNLTKLTNILYCGLGEGLSSGAFHCLLSSLSVTSSLCLRSNKLRETILSQTDFLSQLSCQLQELKYFRKLDQFIKDLTVSTLNAVMSLSKTPKYHWQIIDSNLPEFMLSYCESPLLNVATAAQMALSPLGYAFTSQVVKHLSMTESIILKLSEAQVSEHRIILSEVFGKVLSLLDVLAFISFLLDDMITAASVSSGQNAVIILTVISSILQLSDHYIPEKEISLLVVWKLLFINKSALIFEQEELVAQLLSITGSSVASLQGLASCVLWKLNDDALEDIPHMYAEECFNRGCYDKCISICDQLLKSGDAIKSRYETLLLKGKSLYHIFSTELALLKQEQRHLLEKEFRQQQSNCLTKAKDVIQILGYLYDKDVMSMNTEGSKILDWSMIMYAYEINSLQACRRCLLCRKKASELKRSHIWPRSILQRFSSGVELPKSKKTMLVSWQSQERYWSPKDVTFFLFCGVCEKTLNLHGETQFIPDFFDRVYDRAQGSRSAKSIEYSSWLYQFCIGIIFRGLSQPNMTKFVNTDEIYLLLSKCREFLLGLASNGGGYFSCSGLPDIYIIIGPTESDNDGFINRVLNMPAFYGVEEIELSTGTLVKPRSAQYFIAHFGLINIVTMFKGSKFSFNEANRIHIAGGILRVQENNQRQHLMPPGLWTLFRQLAQEFQVSWLTRSSKAVQIYAEPSKQLPSSEIKDLMGIVSATEQDFASMNFQIQPSIQFPKVVSFLPKNFRVLRSKFQQPCIELPVSHRILLHYLIPLNEGEETLFLCVGDVGDYSLRKPYIIYHYFLREFELMSAFFISPEDLTAKEFLPESEGLFEVDKVQPVVVFRQYIHKLLPTILQEKGFFSFASLLFKIRSGNAGSVDLKCQSVNRCWYCIERCDLCMKTVPFGCVRKSIQSIPIQYCVSCQGVDQIKGSMEAKVKVVSQDDQQPLPLALSSLSTTHQALVTVHCEATVLNRPLLMEFALFTAKNTQDLPMESAYVVYHLWNLFSQQFLEFTVSADMCPSEPVIYTEGEMSKMAVIQLREMPIQKILLQTVQSNNMIV